MGDIKDLAQQVRRLSPEEQCRLIRLVPELLRLDEEFLLQRWRSAREDLECGRVIEAPKALQRARARRRVTK